MNEKSRHLAVIVTFLILTASCGDGVEHLSGRGSEDPPSVLVILVDALRADHLGSYGYARPTSPELDRLATTSVRFTDAYAPSSWTKPSIPSLFTSLYPSGHGVHEGNARAKGDRLESDLLSEEAWTLAEGLGQCGYETGAFVHNAHLRSVFGLAQGFDRYDEMSARAPAMVRQMMDWLGARDERAPPFLAYLHLLDVHWPYEPPAEAARLLGVEQDAAFETDKLRQTVNGGYRELTAEEIGRLERLYDAEIRGVDTALGMLFRELAATGLDRNLVVVVTSDHGEAFLEHGHLGHGHDLYEESVRVPLLLRLPGGEGSGTVVGDRVSTLDIMPTLLDLGRCEDADLERLDGRSLLPLVDGSGQRDGTAYAEVRHGGTQIEALWSGRWKLIRTSQVLDVHPSQSTPAEHVSVMDLVGERVTLKGRRLPGNRFAAESVEIKLPGDRDDEIHGILEQLDLRQEVAWVAGFEVLLEDAVLLNHDKELEELEAFEPGRFVKVDGEVIGSGRMIADKMQLRDARSTQRVEGLVRSVRVDGDERVTLELAGLHADLAFEDVKDAIDRFTRPSGSSAGTRTVSNVRHELYDLEADPAETDDRSRSDPQKLQALIVLLASHRARTELHALVPAGRAILDAETVSKLRALGYVQ